MTTSGKRFQEEDSPRLFWKLTLFVVSAIAGALIGPLFVVSAVAGALLVLFALRKFGVV